MSTLTTSRQKVSKRRGGARASAPVTDGPPMPQWPPVVVMPPYRPNTPAELMQNGGLQVSRPTTSSMLRPQTYDSVELAPPTTGFDEAYIQFTATDTSSEKSYMLRFYVYEILPLIKDRPDLLKNLRSLSEFISPPFLRSHAYPPIL